MEQEKFNTVKQGDTMLRQVRLGRARNGKRGFVANEVRRAETLAKALPTWYTQKSKVWIERVGQPATKLRIVR